MIAVLAVWDVAAADTIPLPRARPQGAPTVQAESEPKSDEPAQPSACRLRLIPELAVAPSIPPLVGPGECGVSDAVRLEAVILPDATRVAVAPPATIRCTLAEAVVSWVREEAVPRALELGSALRAIENYDSYDCRGRNRIVGAKMSEHGKGNALDIRSLKLANGKTVYLTDPHVSKDVRDALRKSVCGRFTTVLGPGSDGYHEDHVHVDLAERRGGYRMCQWDVRVPEPPPSAELTIPLPPPRPYPDHKLSAGSKP